MCGICGYIGYGNAFKYGYLGILRLLNRGYDSVGITTIEDNCLLTHKYASDDNEMADSKILKHQCDHNGNISIVHSRWRTVGGKTDENSHPHNDTFNKFSLVHNGIIENYVELKHFLLNNGYTFKSETDTEVIVNLISYYYNNSDEFESLEIKVINAIKKALNEIEGTYALAILCIDTPNNIYCVRHGSPLLIGFTQDDKFIMISSECYGFDNKINRYITLDSNDIIVLSKNDGKVEMQSFENKIYNSRKIELLADTHSPQPYPHWTIKEICDQSISCINAIGMGGRIIDEYNVKLGGIERKREELLAVNNIILLGCGTSYHAGLLSTYMFKTMCDFNSVQVYDGAEFSEKDIPKIGNTCVIFISQSGETKDLHRCLELCKELRSKHGYRLSIIGVINVADSLIAREVDCGIYLNCGREFAVASTKAFSSQVIVLTLIVIWYAQNKNINKELRKEYITKILRLQHDIINTIEQNNDICKEIAIILKNKNSIFILGKDTLKCISKEGSLKLKEIGYIHAEGYSSSALKHGSYALLDKEFPIILLTPNDKYFIRNQGILDELKSRGAYVIGISDIELNNKYNKSLRIPIGSYIEIVSTVLLQLIAYHLSIEKGINCDFPKNLSKTVSVD